MFHSLEQYILSFAEQVPLEIFVTVGSFLEEVIAPIPSPSILIVAGSLGSVQGYTFGNLVALVLLASLGKTIGALVMYHMAVHVKETGLKFLGRFTDLTSSDIDAFGRRFTGSLYDYGVYIFLRSIPIVPSVLLSFGSGVLRLPLRLFITGTLVGTLIRDSFYLVVGYVGLEFLHKIVARSMHIESIVEYIVICFLGLAVIYLLYRRTKRIQKR